MGLRDFMSVAFINVDASAEVPKTATAVRGKQNSILLLQPVNAETTDVTYVVEVQPNGWVPTVMAEFFGDNLIKTLRDLKVELEDMENLEEAGASVEEAARMRFKRHLAQQQDKHSTIVTDVTSSLEDLKVARAALEKRLKDIQKSKSTDGLDLSALEGRVKRDIAQLTARISKMEQTGSSSYQSSKWGSTSK